MISTLLLIIITLLFPPLGVFIVAGCGIDFWINVLLTILGFLPGHVHAFYIEYVFMKRREEARLGDSLAYRDAPGVYSERVLRGGYDGARQGYAVPPEQGREEGYGTIPAR